MKCSKCGKEFGGGANCQNCGVDRVTGLANYSGYDNGVGNSNHSSHKKTEFVPNNITACYACGEIIPADSTYCPYCKKKLLTTCKKCGNTYSTQYSVCNKCGTDRYEYYQEMQAKEKEEKRRKLEETRKKHALEREKQFKMEAQYLKDSFIPSKASILALPLTALILFVLTPLCPFSGPGLLGVVIVGAILLWGIAYMISESIGQSKTTRWKEEHPNDPRSKYL